MIDFNESANPVLDEIHHVCHVLESRKLSTESIGELAPSLEILDRFFQCQPQQSAVLSVLLCMHFNEEEASVKDLIRYLDLKPSAAIQVCRLLELPVARGWMSAKGDIRINPMVSFKFNERFLACVLSNDWAGWKEDPANDSFGLLDSFAKKLSERKNSLLAHERFLESVSELVENSTKADLARLILGHQMDPLSCALLLAFCLQHYEGVDEVNLEKALSDLGVNAADSYRIRSLFKGSSGIFFEQKLVERIEDTMGFFCAEIRLTENVTGLLKHGVKADEPPLSSKLFRVVTPGSIIGKRLLFNMEESAMVEKLQHLLHEEPYARMREKMIGQGMRPGLTILFHGQPGTGKTETALQIARKSGRHLLSADASAIRSKWVGEAEKNMRALFAEYRKIHESLGVCPILLFNEADSLIGKRRRVNDRGDQLENTMQNILLEELEHFEGIFIGTTNLTDNMDEAFDRRILFKIRFNEPDREVSLLMLKDRLHDLDPQLLESLNGQYVLTGAQIENIGKKILVDGLFHEDDRITLDYLKGLAEQEISLKMASGMKRQPIGFVRAA
jgi:hypothetical protein